MVLVNPFELISKKFNLNGDGWYHYLGGPHFFFLVENCGVWVSLHSYPQVTLVTTTVTTKARTDEMRQSIYQIYLRCAKRVWSGAMVTSSTLRYTCLLLTPENQLALMHILILINTI